MHLDQVDYLPDDVLFKTDRAGMLASLEIRTVFLNRELADFAASLDTSVHLAGGGKALLRAMLPAGVLETSRPGRYRKTAFRVPAGRMAAWSRSWMSCAWQPEHGILYSEGYFSASPCARDRRASRRRLRSQRGSLAAARAGLWADRFCGLDQAEQAAKRSMV